MIRRVVILAALAGLGCRLGFLDSQPTHRRIVAEKVANGISLTNLTDRGVAYLLVDPNTLALIDFTPCKTQEADCLRLPPKGTVVVPFDQIVVGSASSTDVYIHNWWVLADNSGSLYVDMGDPIMLKLQP